MTPQQKKACFASPALTSLREGYPKRYNGKVPKLVCMNQSVRSDLPFVLDDGIPAALTGEVYPVWVNSYGAVAIIYPDGGQLGVKPDEFTVIEYHDKR